MRGVGFKTLALLLHPQHPSAVLLEDTTPGHGFGPLKKALRKYQSVNVMDYILLQMLICRHTNENCPFHSCYCQRSGTSTENGEEVNGEEAVESKCH